MFFDVRVEEKFKNWIFDQKDLYITKYKYNYSVVYKAHFNGDTNKSTNKKIRV